LYHPRLCHYNTTVKAECPPEELAFSPTIQNSTSFIGTLAYCIAQFNDRTTQQKFSVRN